MDSIVMPCFQPVYCLATKQVDYFEALARIKGDASNSGHVELFKIAQQYRFFGQIDLAMLKHALILLPYVQYPIAVNLSAQSMEVCRDELLKLISESSCSYNLIVEVSDSEDVGGWNHILAFAAKAKTYGVKFAVDNHGENHRSVQNIKSLTPAYVKVSRAVVDEMIANNTAEPISNLIDLRKRQGFKLLAEKVDSEKCLSEVCRFPFDQVQGFAFGVPELLSANCKLV